MLLYSIRFQNIQFQLIDLDHSNIVINANQFNSITNHNVYNLKWMEKYNLCSLLFHENVLDLVHCLFKIQYMKIELIMNR